jgi:hypothetical protein
MSKPLRIECPGAWDHIMNRSQTIEATGTIPKARHGRRRASIDESSLSTGGDVSVGGMAWQFAVLTLVLEQTKWGLCGLEMA